MQIHCARFRLALAPALLAMALISPIAANAQPQTRQPESSPRAVAATAADGISVSGRAVNAQTGEGLGKLELRLFSGRSTSGQSPSVFTARTRSDGTFQLEGIPAGEYLLTLVRRAFATTAADLRGFASARPQGRGWMVTLRAGQTIRGVEIRIPPAAVITGQVFDEDGEPMTGVVVEAEQYRYVQGVKALSATGRATSDDRGMYRIYDLAPGRYFVKTQGRSLRSRLGAAFRGGMMPGFGGPGSGGPQMPAGRGEGTVGVGARMAALAESIAYPETYYPNARSVLEAIPLQLSPGAEMGGIDFALAPSPTFSISGTVGGTGEMPAAGESPRPVVFVTARPAGQPGFGDAAGLTPANPRTGAFTIGNLAPGNYQLIARSNSRRGGGSSSVGSAQVTLGNASIDGVHIPIYEDVTVPGKVILPGGYSGASLARMSITPIRQLSPVRAVARADANGAFEITLSGAEAPRFAFSGVPEGLYVKRVSLGGVDLLGSASHSLAGVSGSIAVELADDGASLSGTLRDSRDHAIANARLSLIPASAFDAEDGLARSVWRQTVTTQDDGSFAISAIAPGRYRLYAFENLDADPSFDTDFLSNFGRRWKDVELKPKESATVEIVPIPASETDMYLGETQ